MTVRRNLEFRRHDIEHHHRRKTMKYRMKKTLLVTAIVGAVGIGTLFHLMKPAQDAMQLVSNKQASRHAPARVQTGGTVTAGNAPPKSTPHSNAVTAALQATASSSGSPAVANATKVSYGMTDGTYTGQREYAYYGYVRVQAIVQNGKVQQVRVLEHPNDNGTSRYINSIAMPYLVQEAVQAQNSNVSLISGATLSSEAFVKSLTTALSQAGS
jgi:uncharacterized protein with FMN-binding domain